MKGGHEREWIRYTVEKRAEHYGGGGREYDQPDTGCQAQDSVDDPAQSESGAAKAWGG
jgi:hypothetical protein